MICALIHGHSKNEQFGLGKEANSLFLVPKLTGNSFQSLSLMRSQNLSLSASPKSALLCQAIAMTSAYLTLDVFDLFWL